MKQFIYVAPSIQYCTKNVKKISQPEIIIVHLLGFFFFFFTQPSVLRWWYTKGRSHIVRIVFTLYGLLFHSTYDLCFKTMYVASCTTQGCANHILLAYLLAGLHSIQTKTEQSYNFLTKNLFLGLSWQLNSVLFK